MLSLSFLFISINITVYNKIFPSKMKFGDILETSYIVKDLSGASLKELAGVLSG
jgi:hypothetical protein